MVTPPAVSAKMPFGPGEQLDAVDDFVVGHRIDGAAGLVHHLERVVAVGRVADGERLGDRVGLHRPDDVGAFS